MSADGDMHMERKHHRCTDAVEAEVFAHVCIRTEMALPHITEVNQLMLNEL
jgi:hypothetical protein